MTSEIVFEWDENKEVANRAKHGVSFEIVRAAFEDPERVIVRDETHSATEIRYYCIGQVKEGVLMVRFTCRANRIRIFGAGFWWKGKKIYDERNR